MSKLANIDLPIHHIGFAVRNIDETEPSFVALGAVFYRKTDDPERNLRFSFGKMGGVMVELVSPYDPQQKCAVSGYVEKQACTPYHVCFVTKDIEAEINRLKSEGFKRVGKVLTSDIYGPITTGVFMYSLNMGLVEIVMEEND